MKLYKKNYFQHFIKYVRCTPTNL